MVIAVHCNYACHKTIILFGMALHDVMSLNPVSFGFCVNSYNLENHQSVAFVR